MKRYGLENLDMTVPAIGLGCMRIGDMSVSELEKWVEGALELGLDFFDHADIYAGGRSEEKFGLLLRQKPNLRDQMIIQTKCGIKSNGYDLSKEHIIKSTEDSLRRLNTEFVEVLMLHRPDLLMEGETIADAFDTLHRSGKVKYFAVSNMNGNQMDQIKRHTSHRLLFNQIQLSLVHAPALDELVYFNTMDDRAIPRTSGIIEYCEHSQIKIQCWSALQASWEEGTFLKHPAYKPLNDKLEEIADRYDVTPAAVAIAWLLRHPSQFMPITGTTSLDHLKNLSQAVTIQLSREEWYALYTSAGRQLP